jgi:hypothetical protein
MYWKALTIIQSLPIESTLNLVTVMASLRLQEHLQLVYGSNPVSNMLSGKAVSQAICGHLLLDVALNTILVANA